MNDPAKARDLRNTTQRMLRDVGFKDAEVDNAWQGRAGFSLRDHRVQLVIRDAALWRQAQARAQNISAQRRHAPPPQRPGTVAINRAGDENAARIASLQRQLESATGNRALKLGQELHQLNRAAGRT